MYNLNCMNYELLKKLKSGSDVRGIASEITSPVTLTDEAVNAIVRAFIQWYSIKYGKNPEAVAVGHDVRISGDRILKQVLNAATDCGCDAVNCGLCSTPSMFMLLKVPFGCEASVMITASHLPSDRNGLKFFTPEGGLNGEDIDAILKLAAEGNFPAAEKLGTVSYRSYLPYYCRSLVEKVRSACGEERPLEGKKIIVDAGNGAGGFFCDMVLKPLGADTDGSIYLEPDGTFPNHIPNPEDKTAMEHIKRAVLSSGADLGVIFDTDVDRAGAVDCDGREINRNDLIALASVIALEGKGGTIVTDSVTSDGLTEFIESLGGKHVRFKRGYKNVIDEAIRRNASGEHCPLAIETSGHAAFEDNYFLDDGAYLITRILTALAKQTKNGGKLGDLIKTLKHPAEEDEVRISFNSSSKDFKAEGARVIEDIKKRAEKDETMRLAPDNYEGVKVSFKKDDGDGWFLVRMSVHDPVMPINFESNAKGGDKIIAAKLYELIKSYPFLNAESLEKFIQTTESPIK